MMRVYGVALGGDQVREAEGRAGEALFGGDQQLLVEDLAECFGDVEELFAVARDEFEHFFLLLGDPGDHLEVAAAVVRAPLLELLPEELLGGEHHELLGAVEEVLALGTAGV